MADRLKPIRVENIAGTMTLVFPDEAVLEETDRHWIIWKDKNRKDTLTMISKGDRDTFGLAMQLFAMMGNMAEEKFDAVRLPRAASRR